ncbi:MAG: rhomboid family intramembrane serine protease [Deltaproteobacteria bacterium]|nr:rhomboid family intramembrane serine protease [Deltaproteobacteria bacterium]
MDENAAKEASDRIREYSIAIKLSRRAYIPFVFVMINVLVWILITTMESGSGGAGFTAFNNELLLIIAGAKVNELISQGELWRLFTSIFLHGGVLHLVLNCVGIFFLGHLAANIYGAGKFSLIYVLSGLGGALLSYFFSSPPSVGSSGAIFGLLGAVTIFGIRNRALLPHSFKRLLVAGPLFWVAVNFIYGASEPNVDNAAHIGGLASGSLAGFFLGDSLLSKRRKTLPAERALAVALSLIALLSVYKSSNSLSMNFSVQTPQISIMKFKALPLPYPGEWKMGIHSGGRCLEADNDLKPEEIFLDYNLCFIDPYYATYIIGSNLNARICPPGESLLSGRYSLNKPVERRTPERIEFYFPFSPEICGFLSIPAALEDKYEETVKTIFRRYENDMIIL